MSQPSEPAADVWAELPPPPAPAPGLLRTWAWVLLRPASFFESFRGERYLSPALLFAYAMMAVVLVTSSGRVLLGISPLGTHTRSQVIFLIAARLALMPLEAGFIGGLVLRGLARLLGATEGSYRQAIVISLYALAGFGIPLGLLPLTGPATAIAGVLSTLCWFYLAATGAVVLQRARRVPTWVVFGLLALGFAGWVIHDLLRVYLT